MYKPNCKINEHPTNNYIPSGRIYNILYTLTEYKTLPISEYRSKQLATLNKS